MIERLAITAVGVLATAVLTVGLVAAGFAPRPADARPVDATLTLDADGLTATGMAVEETEDPAVQPETVYIAPAPTPETIVAERGPSSPIGSPGRSQSDDSLRRMVLDDETSHDDEPDEDEHGDRDLDEHEDDD